MLSFRHITGAAIILFLLSIVSVVFVDAPTYIMTLPWLFWLVFTAIGSFHIRWNYHLQAVHRSSKQDSKRVAVTFDDGPNPKITPKILDVLKKHNATATFFCVGQQMKKHPQLLKRMHDEQHTIGNHTFSHSNAMGFFGKRRMLSELQQTNNIAKEILGVTLRWFRPAFGVTNPAIKSAVSETELHVVGWSIRSFDTLPISEASLVQRITKRIRGGDIILLHDSSEKTVAVLERLLLFLHDKRMEAVSIDVLLKNQV